MRVFGIHTCVHSLLSISFFKLTFLQTFHTERDGTIQEKFDDLLQLKAREKHLLQKEFDTSLQLCSANNKQLSEELDSVNLKYSELFNLKDTIHRKLLDEMNAIMERNGQACKESLNKLISRANGMQEQFRALQVNFSQFTIAGIPLFS